MTVGIAELRNHLSRVLRQVRSGRTVTVLDRQTPIARLVPLETGRHALRVRSPAPGSPAPGKVPLPPPARVGTDVLELLLEERQGHR